MTASRVDDHKHSAGVGMWVAWVHGALAVLVQMVTNGRYGYFRDEFYYLAASDHLAFGYVDFAPLIAWLTHASRAVLGDSLHAIRLLPALAFGAEVVLTGLITRELGGRRWGMLLACLSVLMAPVILGNATRLAMNPLEPLFWMGCIYFLLLALNRERPNLLMWCGVLLGFGLENKHSTVFFLGALVVALLVVPDRRLFATKWFWAAAAMAFVIALPNAVWQYEHQFPTLQFLQHVKAIHKNVELPPVPFLRQQIMILNPINALVWIPGLAFLLFHRDGKRYRVLGLTYLAFLAVMMALKAKGLLPRTCLPDAVRRGRRVLGKAYSSAPPTALVASRLARPCVSLGPGLRAAGSPHPSSSEDRSLHGSARHQDDPD